MSEAKKSASDIALEGVKSATDGLLHLPMDIMPTEEGAS
jgi:hypothetical protein